MSNEDVYQLARALAQQARGVGDEPAAQMLEEALVSGTTASEQLGELGVAMTRLAGRIDEKWPEGTREFIRDVARLIQEALARANRGV